MTAPEAPAVRYENSRRTTLLFVALAVAAAVACLVLQGPERFVEVTGESLMLMVRIAPSILASMVIAAFLYLVLPTGLVRRRLGEGSGIAGLAIAFGAGVVTAGGPMASYPVLAALLAAGAELGAAVMYISAWSALALNRLLVWEIPVLGAEFALTRMLVCLPLPIAAVIMLRLLMRTQRKG